MYLVKPSFEILAVVDGGEVLQRIEAAGRTCYKSEEKITTGSAYKFVDQIIRRGHESVIEHESVSVKFVVDRGVTHELVRHRLASYSQESTRYCNYSGGVTFIIPPWVDVAPGEYKTDKRGHGISDEEWASQSWYNQMLQAEWVYQHLLQLGWSPQQARSVLPNSLKTEIVMTANLREWRHVFRLRTSKAAHPQMREIMVPLFRRLKSMIPVVFDDLEVEDV